MRRWAARIVAFGALAAGAVAVVVAVASVHGGHGTSQSDVNASVARLTAANRRLSGELDALKPGASPAAAQATNRATQAMAKQMLAHFDGSDDLASRMQILLNAELAYLDAVGSSVANPHSVLLDKVEPRANELRSALAAMPGAQAGDVHGDRNLVAYSTARGQS